MRILTRMLSTGLLAGAAAVAFTALPTAALAEGGPPTKNIVALPAASDPPDKHIVDPPGPRAVTADWHTPGALVGDEGEPPGRLAADEGDPPGPAIGDEGEPPGTLATEGPTPFPAATDGTPLPVPALLEPPGPR